MTDAEHIAQRALVEASLLADELREHHHDVYCPRPRAAKLDSPHADRALASTPRSVKAAGDGRENPPVAGDPAPECPACHGAGEIAFNPGYPDPQCAQTRPCGDCGGSGVAPVSRAAAGSTRAA